MDSDNLNKKRENGSQHKLIQLILILFWTHVTYIKIKKGVSIVFPCTVTEKVFRKKKK